MMMEFPITVHGMRLTMPSRAWMWHRRCWQLEANQGFGNMVDADFVAGVQDGSVIAGVSGVWNATELEKVWGVDYAATKLPTYTCAGEQVQMSSFAGYKMLESMRTLNMSSGH